MKKIVYLLLALTLLVSCKPTDVKTIINKQFSTAAEMEKDYQIIKILALNDSIAIDCYGLPLKINEWYLRSTKAMSLIPIVRDPNGNFLSFDFESADQSEGVSRIRGNAQVKSFEQKINCATTVKNYLVPVKVKILTLGPRYVTLHTEVGNPHFTIMTSR